MKHFNDEYGHPYDYDDQPRWLSSRELLRLTAGAILFWGAAIAMGCVAWWAL